MESKVVVARRIIIKSSTIAIVIVANIRYLSIPIINVTQTMTIKE